MSFRTFAAEAIADYRTTGAVAPSSRYLARAMLQPLVLNSGCVVVELGPGTGVMTRALLEALPSESTLLAFEINDRFYSYLKEKLPDPRLVLLKVGAQHLQRELTKLGYERADAIVSSLALGFFPDLDRRRLLESLVSVMNHRSVYTQYQYVQGMEIQNGRLRRFSLRPLLDEYFDTVRCTTVWRNIPPAFVFACRKKEVHNTRHTSVSQSSRRY